MTDLPIKRFNHFNIAPSEIEEILRQNPHVFDNVVFGEVTSAGDEIVSAAIVPKSPLNNAEEEKVIVIPTIYVRTTDIRIFQDYSGRDTEKCEF